MENAAEALKMGAWTLIFVVALTITLSVFSQARQTSDAIVTHADREYVTEYIPESGETERIVGIESIIPTIYRAFKENYIIIFPEGYNLYYYYDQSNNKKITNKLEKAINNTLSNASINKNDEDLFLNFIMYGKNRTLTADEEFKWGRFQNNFKIEFNTDGFISQLGEHKYIERLGVYYENEEKGYLDIPEANKTEKRVITYEEVKK